MAIKYEDLGKRVKETRRARGLSQEKLAELVGVGTTHISHIESGKKVPSVKLVVALMNSLEMSPNYLFCGTVETAQTTLLKDTERLFEDCTPEQVRKLTKTLEALKKIEMEE